MLHNEVFSLKLCAIAIDEAHVLRQWGTSQNNKMAAFRETYGKLYELRSLAPDVQMIALTATATCLTRDTIINILHMEQLEEIEESPNKLNATYVVHCMDKGVEHEDYFFWLADELRLMKQNSTRTIVYCQTIKQCGIIYATTKGLLGKEIVKSNGDALVEMLHACTPKANKESILESFQHEQGSVRLLIATIAFGMGVDCKGVTRVVHYGPSKSIEAYVQETGRAGRDGSQSIAFILYHGVLLNHVDVDIKAYVKAKDCRRKALLKHFEYDSVYPEIKHLCCDNCASVCECGVSDCGSHVKFPIKENKNNVHGSGQERNVTPQDRKHVKEALVKYHKSLVIKLLSTTANGEVKTLTNLQFLLGFSEHQISQVMENVSTFFTMSDVYTAVEVWDKKHAQQILTVIGSVFNDIVSDIELNIQMEENYDFDDEFLDEWDEVLQDDELFDMIIDNISLSHLDMSVIEEQQTDSSESMDDETV